MTQIFACVIFFVYLCTRFGCITRSARNNKVSKSRNSIYAELSVLEKSRRFCGKNLFNSRFRVRGIQNVLKIAFIDALCLIVRNFATF